jgi:hypothetical protein
MVSRVTRLIKVTTADQLRMLDIDDCVEYLSNAGGRAKTITMHIIDVGYKRIVYDLYVDGVVKACECEDDIIPFRFTTEMFILTVEEFERKEYI